MRYLVAALIVVMLPLAGLGQSSPPPSTAAIFGLDLAGGVTPDAAAREGVKWVRVSADWSVIEPSRGRFVWHDLDAAVEQSLRAGVRPVVLLANTPNWAALDPGAPEDVWKHQTPRDIAAWQRFVATTAARYRGRVAAWQVEPALDLEVFRGTVTDYLALLHAARIALRSADPQAQIIAASPTGLDLMYVKAMLLRAPDEFDALMLAPKGRSPEDLLEALVTARSRIPSDGRHALWLIDSGASEPGAGTGAGTADRLVKTAAAAVAGGVAHLFWSGLAAAPPGAGTRQTVVKMLDSARPAGWLPQGPGAYVFVMTGGAGAAVMGNPGTFAVAWSTAGNQTIALSADGPLHVMTTGGAAKDTPPPDGGRVSVTVGASPVFVQGLGPAVASEAAQQGPFRIPLDPAHDFSRAESVSVTLGAHNVEHGLYNERFRSIPSGALVPVTVDGRDALRTDVAKDAVYVYLDVDHSYAYFLDGHDDIVVAVEVHRAAAPQQVGFNILYDSTTGYRFTPWQWIDAGTGWTTYTVRLADADFSSAWGWDLAINGAGDKKGPLVVGSVVLRRIPHAGRGVGR